MYASVIYEMDRNLRIELGTSAETDSAEVAARWEARMRARGLVPPVPEREGGLYKYRLPGRVELHDCLTAGSGHSLASRV